MSKELNSAKKRISALEEENKKLTLLMRCKREISLETQIQSLVLHMMKSQICMEQILQTSVESPRITISVEE